MMRAGTSHLKSLNHSVASAVQVRDNLGQKHPLFPAYNLSVEQLQSLLAGR